MARFDRINNQAPVETQLEKDSSPVGRSAHDFSYIHSGNAIFGAVIPVDCFDVVPNEDLQINLASLLEFRNPTTRQLLNSCRVYFHAYYNRLSDLWEGARNWIDKGRSGKISLTRPSLTYIFDNSIDSKSAYANACTPMSLLNFLGLPAQVIHKDENFPPLRSFEPAANHYDYDASQSFSDYEVISYTPDYFPADCCMAYQRNWRDYYSNKNLLQNNKLWFPDNEEHFILSYACESACCINYGNEELSSDPEAKFFNISGTEFVVNDYDDWKDSISVTPECNNPITSMSSDQYSAKYSPNLAGLRFRQFRGDRFTTALPFPDLIRGDIPTLLYNEQNIPLRFVDDSSETRVVGLLRTTEQVGTHSASIGVLNSSASKTPDNVATDNYAQLFTKIPSTSITMSDIYTLETLTAFKRRMSMTNGDYNDMIEAQFGVNPHVHDRHATYIGGYYQDFAFNSVTQTSESSSTPLGTKAGQGVSSGNGSIGNFHVPDYGWIQIYMSIVPDVMYTQGKPRMFSKKSNLEMYFPIFNNLPAQAIRNDELFISNDSTTNSNPFAYEDRYAEYKSRTNRVSGFMALNHSLAAFDSAKVMARRFSSTPALNSQFVTMVPENIDMEVFTVVDEPPIDFSCGVSVRRVFPGPYTAIEGSLSSPALMR